MRAPEPPPLPEDLESLLRRLRLPHIRRAAPEVPGHRPLATLGAGRSAACPAGRRAGRPGALGLTDSAQSGQLPLGQDLRGLGTQGLFHPRSHPGRPAHARMGAPAENLVVCGPSGTGKTFFLEALGQAAVEAGIKVAWFALEDLGVLVRRHRADDTVTRAVGRILAAELVVVDDIGLLPVSLDAAEGLYRLVDAAYERRSVAVSSNLHPSGFDELMPKTLASATVDRLMHHAHVCVTTGDSVRLQQATTGKGVKPLT